MMTISYPALIGLLLLCVLIGRAIQNWCNHAGEAERLAYRIGYHDGTTGKRPRA